MHGGFVICVPVELRPSIGRIISIPSRAACGLRDGTASDTLCVQFTVGCWPERPREHQHILSTVSEGMERYTSGSGWAAPAASPWRVTVRSTSLSVLENTGEESWSLRYSANAHGCACGTSTWCFSVGEVLYCLRYGLSLPLPGPYSA